MTDYNHKLGPRPKPLGDPLTDQADQLKSDVAKWLRSAGTPLELSKVVLKETLSSTQDHLLDQLNSSLRGLAVVSALNQTHARGQHQRRWQTRTGDLALSAAIPIRRDHIAHLPKLPLWIALEVARELNLHAPANSRIWLKWPNDLVTQLVHSDQPFLKLGGILCQFVPLAKPDHDHDPDRDPEHDPDHSHDADQRPTQDLALAATNPIAGHVIMGVGINRLRSPNPIDTTADLQQLGIQLELAELRAITVKALIRACVNTGLISSNHPAQPANLAEHYNPKHLLSGHRVTLKDSRNGQLLSTGVCQGVDAGGALLIKDKHSSSTQRFLSGQLRLADSAETRSSSD
jgi:biotin-(acetyl-CoA carboxylase) ligase